MGLCSLRLTKKLPSALSYPRLLRGSCDFYFCIFHRLGVTTFTAISHGMACGQRTSILHDMYSRSGNVQAHHDSIQRAPIRFIKQLSISEILHIWNVLIITKWINFLLSFIYLIWVSNIRSVYWRVYVSQHCKVKD